MSRQIITEIVGDASKFNAATKDAADHAGKFQNVLQGIGQGIGQYGFGLVQQGIGAVTNFLEGSIDAAIKDQLAVEQLGTALKANVPNWDGNSEAIDTYIASAEKASAFSRDDLRTSLESLVGAVHDVAKAEDLQTTATNLARFAHIDLQSATELVIKANEGVYKGLAPLGIRLKATTDSQTALNAINDIAAGQDSSYIATRAGQLDELNNSLHDSQVTLGDWIEGNFEAAARGAGKVGDAIDSFNNALDRFFFADQQRAKDYASENALDTVTQAMEHDSLAIGTTVAGVGDQIKDAAPDIVAGWDAMESIVVSHIKGSKKTFDAIVPTLDLTPIIVSDSKRLDSLLVQLAKVEANRDAALKAHDSITVAKDDATIQKLTDEINGLAHASDTNNQGKGVKAFAAGGDFGAGQVALVGEQGPEVVKFGSAGHVYPSGKAGGLTVNVNIAPGSYIDGPAIDKLTNAIVQRLRFMPGN